MEMAKISLARFRNYIFGMGAPTKCPNVFLFFKIKKGTVKGGEGGCGRAWAPVPLYCPFFSSGT